LAAARGDELASLNRVNALVLQALREAVVVVDGHGVVRHFNSRAERLLGSVRRDTTVPELMPVIVRWQRAGSPPYAQPVKSNIRGQQLIGRMVPLEENGTQLLVLFLQNVAELAAEAQRLKLTALGRLTANIAHEIRNPLAAISHASELLAEDATDPASRRLAGMVQDNTRRINRLVEEVLQLNRRAGAVSAGSARQPGAGQPRHQWPHPGALPGARHRPFRPGPFAADPDQPAGQCLALQYRYHRRRAHGSVA